MGASPNLCNRKVKSAIWRTFPTDRSHEKPFLVSPILLGLAAFQYLVVKSDMRAGKVSVFAAGKSNGFISISGTTLHGCVSYGGGTADAGIFANELCF